MDHDGTSGEGLRHLIGRLEARTEEATELRIRLELTEKGQSTLEDDLAEERRSLSHNTMARLSASPNLSMG
jgi:DNA-binding MarR family transcriptional regulator